MEQKRKPLHPTRAVKLKENEMSDFVREMRVLMHQQKDDVVSDIFNKGPYELAPSFRSFYVPETDWFKKKKREERSTHGKLSQSKIFKGKRTRSDSQFFIPDKCKFF